MIEQAFPNRKVINERRGGWIILAWRQQDRHQPSRLRIQLASFAIAAWISVRASVSGCSPSEYKRR